MRGPAHGVAPLRGLLHHADGPQDVLSRGPFWLRDWLHKGRVYSQKWLIGYQPPQLAQ